MYLKDLSPYLRQFLPYSNSQNTIRVNLLGNPTLLVIEYVINYSIPIYLAYQRTYCSTPTRCCYKSTILYSNLSFVLLSTYQRI